jgi:hypothetical protein
MYSVTVKGHHLQHGWSSKQAEQALDFPGSSRECVPASTAGRKLADLLNQLHVRVQVDLQRGEQ